MWKSVKSFLIVRVYRTFSDKSRKLRIRFNFALVAVAKKFKYILFGLRIFTQIYALSSESELVKK